MEPPVIVFVLGMKFLKSAINIIRNPVNKANRVTAEGIVEIYVADDNKSMLNKESEIYTNTLCKFQNAKNPH